MTRMKPQTEDRYVPALSFDFLTPFYDLAVKLTTREKVFKERLVGRIEIPPDGRLLDLACGTGTLTIAIKRRFPAAFRPGHGAMRTRASRVQPTCTSLKNLR